MNWYNLSWCSLALNDVEKEAHFKDLAINVFLGIKTVDRRWREATIFCVIYGEYILVFCPKASFNTLHRRYPAKRALPAMLAHGSWGPFGRIPSTCQLHKISCVILRVHVGIMYQSHRTWFSSPCIHKSIQKRRLTYLAPGEQSSIGQNENSLAAHECKLQKAVH